MAARVGITRDAVIDVALAVLAEEGPDGMTLGAVARRLGIRTQSLYAHVDGADGLRRAVAIHGLRRLTAKVTAATIGVDGVDALRAIVAAHLSAATDEPDLYDLSIHPPGDDPELADALLAANEPLTLVCDRLGFAADDRVHWTRLMLSSVAGYSRLRSTGRFTLPADDTETARRLLDMLVAAAPTDGGG